MPKDEYGRHPCRPTEAAKFNPQSSNNVDPRNVPLYPAPIMNRASDTPDVGSITLAGGENKMASKSPVRDRKSDELSILSVLRRYPERVFGCAGLDGLARLSGVPKSSVRGLIEGHPEVHIAEERTQKGKRFTFRLKQA